MATWILRSTGGEFSTEGRDNWVSSGRAPASAFIRADLYALPPPAPPIPPPPPAALPTQGSRFTFLFRGGEVSADARTELMSNGAKEADFVPVGTSMAARVGGLDFGGTIDAAPTVPVPAGVAFFVDVRSGATVSAAAVQNLIAQGRAAATDFRPA